MTSNLAMKRALAFSVLVLIIYGLIVMQKSSYESFQDNISAQHSNHTAQRVTTPSDAYRHHETLADVAKSALDYGRINNASLGFGKVFVLSLPERSDKRDTLVVQASLSNFSVTFLDGVDGASVSEKALPYKFKQGTGQTGCWRGHLDVAKKMVRENIETALILEDDADWEVSLHAQLREVARGARWLGGQDHPGVYPRSPYGDEWDLLWLGHCALRPDRNDDRRWVIPKDPTVVPSARRWDFERPRMDKWESGDNPDPQTRIVFKAENGVCANGYALTLKGARKMLYRLSMMPYNDPIDVGLGMLCGNEGESNLNFNCIGPFPEIIGVSRPAGRSNRGSDIDGRIEKVEEKSWSERLVFPVRQNVAQLLRQETVFVSSYPELTGQTLDLAQLNSIEGHGEHIDLELERQMNAADKAKTEALQAEKVKEDVCHLADSQDYNKSAVDAVNYRTGARIAKVSAHFGKQSPAFDEALRTHADHAKRHGYQLKDMRDSIFDALWNKPAYIMSLILAELQKPADERLEWLFWFDRDTVILNQCMPLHIFLPPKDREDIHVVIADDFQGLNNGVFAVRVSEWSIRLYGAILGYRELRPDDDLPFTEQSAMERVLKENAFSNGVAYYPQRWFNAYGFQVKDADLLVHFAGVENRKEEIMKWIDKTDQNPETWQKDYRLTELPEEIMEFWADFPNSQHNAKDVEEFREFEKKDKERDEERKRRKQQKQGSA